MTRPQATTNPAGTLARRIDAIMTDGIARGVFPGGVVLVRHRDDVVLHRAWGHAVTHRDAHTRLAEPIPAHPDTRYDLASITKLFTATCAMQLVDEGRIGLDDPVATHLPAFAANGKTDITLRHLLAHTSGLPGYRLWEHAWTPGQRRAHALTVSPVEPAGTAMVYRCTNLIVVGHLIEALTGTRLDAALQRGVLDPLGLRHTGFGPLDPARTRVAATEDQAYVDRGMVHGEVHDENAWCLGGVAGNAGLFGTARDLSVFGQMHLDGGTLDGARVLAPETVAEMTRNQAGAHGCRGLGWQLNADHTMGDLASPRTYGHTGFTGTSIVIDPRRELVVVLLTNRVHPGRNGPGVDPFRRAVADAVLETIDASRSLEECV